MLTKIPYIMTSASAASKGFKGSLCDDTHTHRQKLVCVCVITKEDTLHTDGIALYIYTRISGPYGPLKILAPAGGLLASLTV